MIAFFLGGGGRSKVRFRLSRHLPGQIATAQKLRGGGVKYTSSESWSSALSKSFKSNP